MFNNDTIAAIATGIGSFGIGIIRVSGSRSVQICDLIFKGAVSLKEAPSHTVLYGHILDGENVVDEVLCTKFLAPRSYTREDVVEISSHGGAFVMKKILSLLLSSGARAAEAGEFTKRAFLNGRIDLAQAESVMDIIASDNERMLSNSLHQLDGVLSEKIRELREYILHECAYIEAALDDPEHYDLLNYPLSLSEKITDWKAELNEMILSTKQGRILRDGIRTAIVGRPNAGKSSLLNALSRSDRAIVTDVPGTTRDTIEEKVRFYDMTLLLLDTAGIRNTDNVVEKIGVERSLMALEDCDLILYVVDLAQDFSNEDLLILNKLDFNKTIPVFNKIDLLEKSSDSFTDAVNNKKKFLEIHNLSTDWFNNGCSISAKHRQGLSGLAEKIRQKLELENVDNSVDILITNERHAALLRECFMRLAEVEKSIALGMPEDFFTVDMMEAYTLLGAIIGEAVEDDLVDKVFRDFCMGK